MSSLDSEEAAERFAAIQGWRILIEEDGERRRLRTDPPARRLPLWDILDYAERGDSLADISVERALRANPANMKAYLRFLTGCAEAVSPVAMAASGAEALSRQVGPHRIDIVEETSGRWLAVRLAGDAQEAASGGKLHRTAYAIEARAEDGTGVRVDLGRPVAHTLSLPLDPAYPELAELARILARPDCAIFLIRVAENGA
jgi:hypothetical protein